MNALNDNLLDSVAFASPPRVGGAARKSSSFDPATRPSRPAPTALRSDTWDGRSERWRCLMAAAQSGDSHAYEQLLREIDVWLRRYYARRLPHPAAEDARQDALLAIHAKRHTYASSRSFGAWVLAIARYKWVDRIREASRFRAVSLDDEIPIEDHGGAAISAAAMDDLLGRLKPAQASVIRLVKLKGLSIARASGATGQSVPLVKVNIHRGLKKLAALVSCDVITTITSANSSEPGHVNRSASPPNRGPRHPATEK
jgi:RNA polymerase sigma factor (sigma-70 family)